MSEPLRWASLLRSSIIDFNRLAPPLQDALFKSKLRPASQVCFFCKKFYNMKLLLGSDFKSSKPFLFSKFYLVRYFQNIIKLLELLEKSGILSSGLVASLSSALSNLFNISSHSSSLLMRIRLITLKLEEILQVPVSSKLIVEFRYFKIQNFEMRLNNFCVFIFFILVLFIQSLCCCFQ